MGLAAHGVWDLSFLTRDQTHHSCIAGWILYRWTMREDPLLNFLSKYICPLGNVWRENLI